MECTEKNLELIKICSTEYMDKHRHYWNIYFKFLLGIAFVTSLYVFGEKNIGIYIQAGKTETAVIFSAIILILGVSSFLVMCREHRALLLIAGRYKKLYKKIDVEPYPSDELKFLSKIEKIPSELFSIASILSISLLALTIGCILLICFSSAIIPSAS